MKKRLFTMIGIICIVILAQWSNMKISANASELSTINIKIGKTVEGKMEYGETDTYVLEPDKIGKLTITIKCYVNDTVTASLYSDYNKDNKQLVGGKYDPETGYSTLVYSLLVSPRIYYLDLTNPMILQNGTFTISTKLSAATSDEGNAINNSIDTPMRLDNNKYYRGLLAFDETEDYYCINLKKEQQLKIRVTCKEEASIMIILKDSVGNKIDSDMAYKDSLPYVFNKKVAAGKYFITINKGSVVSHTGRNYAIATGSYAAIAKITIPSTKSLEIGDTYAIKPTIKPAKATESYSYSSSNEKVAKVSSGGRITALKKGTVTITVTTDDSGKKDTCKVTVKEIAVKSIKLNKNSASLYPGGSTTLTASVSPENASYKKASWESSNQSIATVTSSGEVVAKGAGTCKISAKVGGISASCTIKVGSKPTPTPTPKVEIENIEIDSISIQKNSMTIGSIKMSVGDIEEVSVLFTPVDATNKTLQWTSSDTSIVTVDDGKITSLKSGNARIVATTSNGKIAYCTIVVGE